MKTIIVNCQTGAETTRDMSPEEIAALEPKLEDVKKAKLTELNTTCGAVITGRFVANVRGIQYEFSYDEEAQSNFKDVKFAFADAMMTTVTWTAYQNGAVQRITMNAAEFTPVYYASLEHKQNQISRFRDVLQPLVEVATTKEDINTIQW